MPAFSEAKTLPAAAPLLGFGDKFKKPEGAWECGVCMVQNKVQDTKCVSCGIAKPGSETREHPGAYFFKVAPYCYLGQMFSLHQKIFKEVFK